MIYRTASVDPANATAVTSVDTAVTVQGVDVGDLVIAFPPAALEAGLAFQAAWVSAKNQITVRLTNPTAGAINGAARTWEFYIIKKMGGVFPGSPTI